jgi:hypothetical protein
MSRVTEKQDTPILTGLRALAVDREWEVEVIPLVAGQRSVKEKKWLEAFKVFGIGKEDGKRIIGRLGHNEDEKLFGSYWRHTFGPSSSLSQLLGKGISVRASQPPPGRLEMRGYYNNGETVVEYHPSSPIFVVNVYKSL